MSEPVSDISGLLQKVLANPEALQKILKLAGEMKGGNLTKDEEIPNYSEEAFNYNDGEPRFYHEVQGEESGEARHDEGHDEESSEVGGVSRGGAHHYKKKKGKENEEDEHRIQLLCALKPYLNDERRELADVVIRVLKLLRFTDLTELSKLLGGILD